MRSTMELKMMEHVIDVKSIETQICAEGERIKSEKRELDNKLENITDRYTKKHEELRDKAARRIRDVGEHIFKIDEEEFENEIEKPFLKHVTPAWQSLQLHNDESKRRRRDHLESTTEKVVSDIHDFVDQQEQLIDQIERLRTDEIGSLAEPTSIQVPYYIITTESGGQRQKHLIAPSKVTSADGQCAVSLEPLPGMERLIPRTEINTAQTDMIQDTTIQQTIEPYIQENNIPTVSYQKSIKQAVSNQVRVTAEAEK
jgi:hypothetical protein